MNKCLKCGNNCEKEYCWKCKPRKKLKSSGFNKKRKELTEKDISEIEKMNNFFLSIWKKRTHYCTICNIWLGNEPKTYMFDHILEKQKYPELKHEEKNIALLCLECHDKKTRGFYPESYLSIINETKKQFKYE